LSRRSSITFRGTSLALPAPTTGRDTNRKSVRR
jgi:hypothetical protein